MHIRISNDAKMDLARIYWHGVEQFGERQAEQYYQTLTQRFFHIAENPFSYPAVDNIREGYRRSPCGVDSIYYRVTNQTIEIMRILGKQDTQQLLST